MPRRELIAPCLVRSHLLQFPARRKRRIVPAPVKSSGHRTIQVNEEKEPKLASRIVAPIPKISKGRATGPLARPALASDCLQVLERRDFSASSAFSTKESRSSSS